MFQFHICKWLRKIFKCLKHISLSVPNACLSFLVSSVLFYFHFFVVTAVKIIIFIAKKLRPGAISHRSITFLIDRFVVYSIFLIQNGETRNSILSGNKAKRQFPFGEQGETLFVEKKRFDFSNS